MFFVCHSSLTPEHEVLIFLLYQINTLGSNFTYVVVIGLSNVLQGRQQRFGIPDIET